MTIKTTPVQVPIVDLTKSMFHAGEVDLQIELTENGKPVWKNVTQVVSHGVVLSCKVDGVDAPDVDLSEFGVKMNFISEEEYDIVETKQGIFCGMAFFMPHFVKA